SLPDLEDELLGFVRALEGHGALVEDVDVRGTGTRSGRSQPAVELRRDGPPPALPVRGLDQRWPLGSDVDDEVLPTLRRPAEAVDEGGPQGRGDRALLGI